MTDGTSAPPAPPGLDRPVDVMLRAQLDLATEWRCWGVIQHRDGRVFAGRAGDIRIFGTTMVRFDVPDGDGSTTYLFNVAAVDDLLICPEQQARTAAVALDRPGHPIRSVAGAKCGPAAEGDDEPF